jgi:putative solute:sodium symporter small subunit
MSSASDVDARLALADRRYWRRNLVLTVTLLVVWAAVGLGCGVVLADRLNAYSLGGFPLGFWFAQQGAIVVFVVLILVYAIGMALFDRARRNERQRIRRGDRAAA